MISLVPGSVFGSRNLFTKLKIGHIQKKKKDLLVTLVKVWILLYENITFGDDVLNASEVSIEIPHDSMLIHSLWLYGLKEMYNLKTSLFPLCLILM